MEVVLYVYDLSRGMAKAMSGALLGKQIDGIWHTGIVVYGYEYYYGGGIQCASPGNTMAGTPTQTIRLGVTHITQDVFHEFLHSVSPRFTPETYSLLSHNCNNFTSEASQFLVGADIPSWITGLPEEALNTPLGQMLRPMITQFEGQMKQQAAGSFVPWAEGTGAALNLPQSRPSPPASSSSRDESKAPNDDHRPRIATDAKLASYVMLMKVISKKMDHSIQLTVDEYKELQAYAAQQSDTYAQTAYTHVVRILRSWPVHVLFPALGAYRHFTQFQQVCVCVDDSIITRVLAVVSGDTHKRPDRIMALSCIANIMGDNDGAKVLLNDERVVDAIVVALHSTDGRTRAAAANAVYNASLHISHATDDGCVISSFVTAVVDRILAEANEEIACCMLVSLKRLICASGEAKQLVQMLEFDVSLVYSRFPTSTIGELTNAVTTALSS